MSLPIANEESPHRGVTVYADHKGPLKARCQVCVVGSGPGGAVAAYELAAAGLDVILLEEGPPIGKADMRLEPGQTMRRLLRDQGMRVARGNGFFPTMQAIALGGTSLVNSAISVRAPGWVFDEWAKKSGLPQVGAGALDEHYAAVEAFLGIGPTDEAIMGERNLLFKRGCDALGISSEPTPRNVRSCQGSGECFTGCRNGAKQSTDVSYVPAAIKAGARVFTSVRVEGLTGSTAKVRGVVGRLVEPFTQREGPPVEIEAGTVVLAAGCMATPIIMQRSRIGTESGHVGENLQGHPGLAVFGIFPNKVDPWKGATQGYHSLHYLREGLKLEVLWAPPAILAVRFPGMGEDFQRHLLDYDRMAPFDVIVAAHRSKGSVKASPLPLTGPMTPDISYAIDEEDMKRLQRGLCLLSDICFAAGADAVMPGVAGVPEVLDREQGTRPLRDADIKVTDVTVSMNHVFGTTRMGANTRTSVVDDLGRVHGSSNLYLCDTGVFPGSPAVNPMLTCMALARRTARAIAAG